MKRHAKHLLLAVLFATLSLSTSVTPHLAFAGKSGTSGSSTGLALASSSSNQYAPYNCFHEDSMNKRTWTGSLAPGATFSVPLYYCVLGVDGVDPGGATLFTAVSAPSMLALSITAPDGTVHNAHNLGSSNGLTTAATCFGLVPGVSNTIQPGTWTVTLTNTSTSTVKNVTLQGNVEQEWEFMWPQFGCPRQDWNYTPATILSPSNGSTVSGTVTLKAVSSTRLSAFNKMEFYVDGALSGSVDPTSLFLAGGQCAYMTPSQCVISYGWNTTSYRNGSTHTLTVKDYSSAGDGTTSDPVKVTVQN